MGALKDISAIELGAIAARGALESTGVGRKKSITRLSVTHCKPLVMQSMARDTSH
jgi:hypothetical protein